MEKLFKELPPEKELNKIITKPPQLLTRNSKVLYQCDECGIYEIVFLDGLFPTNVEIDNNDPYLPSIPCDRCPEGDICPVHYPCSDEDLIEDF